MRKAFRPAELERDFNVLFGSKSTWSWPYWDGDWFSSAFNLFWGAVVVWIIVSVISVEIPLWVAAIVALAYGLIADNRVFLTELRHRRRLEKKYLPVIENTDAYFLLQEALDNRRRGVVEGLADKNESRKYLLKLWKMAFAEAGRLSTPMATSGPHLDFDDRPIGEQIKSYFHERNESIEELNA